MPPGDPVDPLSVSLDASYHKEQEYCNGTPLLGLIAKNC